MKSTTAGLTAETMADAMADGDGRAAVGTMPGWVWALPGGAGCAGHARRVLREALASLGVPRDAIADAQLMVSELATNAHQHAGEHGPHELWLYIGEPETGDAAGEDAADGDGVDGDAADGERLGGERLGGERLGGERVDGERLGGECEGGERVGGERLGGGRVDGEGPGGEGARGDGAGGEVRCAVFDALPDAALPGYSWTSGDCGRGLSIVRELSGGRWGMRRTRSRLGPSVRGKAVWFAVPGATPRAVLG